MIEGKGAQPQGRRELWPKTSIVSTVTDAAKRVSCL
jgi:hypothetical protein